MMDDTQFKDLEDRFSSLYKYCEREFQFASCLEKGISAFEIASNLLTDKELNAIHAIFECLIDIIDQGDNNAHKEELLEHINLLSDPEKKEVIKAFLSSLSKLTPTPSVRDRSANMMTIVDRSILAKGCKPPRLCWEELARLSIGK
jgi:hypothetical protein